MQVLKLCEQFCPDKIPVVPGLLLGEGVDGQVFDIEGQLDAVIKLCILYQRGPEAPDTMYKRLIKVFDYLQTKSEPTYARLYSYGYMGQFHKKVTWTTNELPYVLYYYVMEKLYKITEDEWKVFHSIISHEDRGIEKNFSVTQIKEMISGLGTCLDFDVERVTFFCVNFKNTGIIHQDIHPRNIMKDAAGNFKLVDFDRARLRR